MSDWGQFENPLPGDRTNKGSYKMTYTNQRGRECSGSEAAQTEAGLHYLQEKMRTLIKIGYSNFQFWVATNGQEKHIEVF